MPTIPHSMTLVNKVQKLTAQHLPSAPVLHSDSLSSLAGANIHLKVESLQRTGSFKIRGALAFFAQMKDSGYQGEVVVSSDSNHARAMALAALQYNHACRIFISSKAPEGFEDELTKLNATVEKKGFSPTESLEHAETYCRENDLQFAASAGNPMVMAGQAISAKEVLEQLPDEGRIGTVVLPIGSGGLMSSVGGLLKQERPNIGLIGVQADDLCEGPPSGTTADLIDTLLDEVVTVSSSTVDKAIAHLFRQHHLVVESAGALTTAALMEEKISIHHRHALLYVTGGNLPQCELTKLLLSKG